MLRISKMADYGTVVMVYLASHPRSFHNAKEIAQAIHLGVATVSKLLKILQNSGLLSSQLGAKGGYALALEAEAISVSAIIQAIEGDPGLTECSVHEGDCSIESYCAIRGNWQLINHAIYTALDSVKLADLARNNLTVQTVDVSEIKGLSGTNQVKGGE